MGELLAIFLSNLLWKVYSFSQGPWKISLLPFVRPPHLITNLLYKYYNESFVFKCDMNDAIWITFLQTGAGRVQMAARTALAKTALPFQNDEFQTETTPYHRTSVLAPDPHHSMMSSSLQSPRWRYHQRRRTVLRAKRALDQCHPLQG